MNNQDIIDTNPDNDSIQPEFAEEPPVRSIAPIVPGQLTGNALKNKQAYERNKVNKRRMHNRMARLARKRNRR